MKRIASNIFPASVLAMLLLVGGCAMRAEVPPLPRPSGTMAVAGFTSPRFNWELLAGYLPTEGQTASPQVVTDLNLLMLNILGEHGVTEFSRPSQVAQCKEIVSYEQSSEKHMAAFKYWVEVGRCMPVDTILVPQVLYWKEKSQDVLGNVQPASVVIDFYLIDVKDARIIRRYHYDETQQSLTDNLLEAGKYFKRKGEWVSAMELAHEGVEAGLRELGL